MFCVSNDNTSTSSSGKRLVLRVETISDSLHNPDNSSTTGENINGSTTSNSGYTEPFNSKRLADTIPLMAHSILDGLDHPEESWGPPLDTRALVKEVEMSVVKSTENSKQGSISLVIKKNFWCIPAHWGPHQYT